MALIEQRLFGPPGTGKTTSLSHHIAQLAEHHGPDTMLVSSFTKAAAHELAGRDLPIPDRCLGTLHAHCYRAIGRGEIAEKKLKQFNEAFPIYALSGAKSDVDDPMAGNESTGETATTGDEYLAKMSVFRARMTPRTLWPESVRAFAKVWDDWKFQNNYIDFTDMVERALRDVECAPGSPRFGIYDEVQDFTPLQLSLVRKWGEHMDYILLGGDDDQASLPGTQVMLEGGSTVAVEDLVPGKHRLVSYDKNGSRLVGFYTGHVLLEKQQTRYVGDIAVVAAGEKATRTTHNHPWLARWTTQAKEVSPCVVYLMRQQDRWRIGWCQLFREDGTLHIGVRARLEKADAAWILHVTDSREDASMMESFFAAQYGIPTVCFTPTNADRGYMTQATIDGIYSRLDAEEQQARAHRLLGMCGRDIALPFYQAGYANRSGATIFQTAACNLLSGYMEVPVYTQGNKVAWEPITVTREPYAGDVYGLSVAPYHTYVADGIVTHNCIYHFSGASPDAFLNPPIADDRKFYLTQSNRIPKLVQDYAENWIRRVAHREPKTYKPRDVEGEVRHLPNGSFRAPEAIISDMQPYLAAGKSVMVLAACGYMLDPLISTMRKSGMLFHNPYRTTRGDWNPIRNSSESSISTAERLLAFLRYDTRHFGDDARQWTYDDLYRWASIIKVEGVFDRGVKKLIDGFQGRYEIIPSDELGNLFTAETWDAFLFGGEHGEFSLDWFAERVVAVKKSGLEYPLQIVKKYGARKLIERPQVIVGTIHSVKGGQADVVYLLPDLSRAAGQEWERIPSDGHDAIIRTFYVGMTRAKESLILCPYCSFNKVELP